MLSKLFEQLSESVIEGQSKQVTTLVKQAISEGVSPKDIINEGLLLGMNEVGVLFKEGELFVPEVLIASRAMNAGMELLKPLLTEGDIERKGKVLMATVKGDLHDIGKKLVSMMLESSGYEIVDIGIDVSPEEIVNAAKEHNPDIIGMSAMLTTTMVSMKDTIETLKEAGLSERIDIMVGGAPVSEKYAKDIGANYAGDAAGAVALANKLTQVKEV